MQLNKKAGKSKALQEPGSNLMGTHMCPTKQMHPAESNQLG